MNNTIKELFDRKSVRVYQDRPSTNSRKYDFIFNY